MGHRHHALGRWQRQQGTARGASCGHIKARTATKQLSEMQLVKSGVVPKGHALVPGAGSAYDAVTLAAAGWKVTALDISSTAVKAATAAAKATPEGKAALQSGALRIQCGDFFQFRSAKPFDIVFDYT